MSGEDVPALLRRLEELETRLAFMDEAQQTLSDVVARQQATIDALQRHGELLADRVRHLSAVVDSTSSEGAERPPHY